MTDPAARPSALDSTSYSAPESQAMATPASGAVRDLRADRFHTGVRFASLLVWFASVVVVFLLSRLILMAFLGELAGGWMFVLAIASMILAQPLAYWGEKKLMALWPSGRALRLEAGALTLREKSGAARVDFGQKVNFWRWRFAISGRQGGRVPNGHYCVAMRLVQNDASFSVYAFFPPKAAAALATRYAFYELRRTSEVSKFGGRDTMYLAAEKMRWESGAELDPGDFEALLAHLAAYVPDFASASAS